ncbi:hypothetical protein MASR1M45_25040 [Candidatus Kapaibacterium sp.]
MRDFNMLRVILIIIMIATIIPSCSSTEDFVDTSSKLDAFSKSEYYKAKAKSEIMSLMILLGDNADDEAVINIRNLCQEFLSKNGNIITAKANHLQVNELLKLQYIRALEINKSKH